MSIAALNHHGVSNFLPRNLVNSVGSLALTSIVVGILSNLPTAKAMDDTGYRVCLNACRGKYANNPARLKECRKDCYNAFMCPG